MASPKPDSLTPRQKAAVLMIALGQETAGEILGYLQEDEVEELTEAISEMELVSSEVMDQVLEEFETLLLTGRGADRGGIGFVTGALESALGPAKAAEVLGKLKNPTARGRKLPVLYARNPARLLGLLKEEHPQTVAVVLSRLNPEQSAEILQRLPDTLQSDVTWRIATMGSVDPQVLDDIEDTLSAELEEGGDGREIRIQGADVLASILRQASLDTEEGVISHLIELDPELAEEVRNQIITFDDILLLTGQEIQMLLRETDRNDLILGLKAAEAPLRDRVFENMSERMAGQLREEMDFAGRVPRKDAKEAQGRILQKLRALEESGQIVVVRGNDDTFI